MGTKFGGSEWRMRGHAVGQGDLRSRPDDGRRVENMFKGYAQGKGPVGRGDRDVDDRCRSVRQALSKGISFGESHIIGSLTRGTAIRGRMGVQVDLMIVLDRARHGDWLRQGKGPGECICRIRERLVRSPEFRYSRIDWDKGSVSVRFRDLTVRILPAFRAEDGYRIPDPSGRRGWIATDPRAFNRVLRRLDRRFRGRPNEMIRIVKTWNEGHGGLLRSYHIENMVYRHYRDRPRDIVSTLQEDVLNFYARLPFYLQNPTTEPVTGERVDEYLDGDRTKAIKNAQLSAERLVRAEADLRRGRTDDAIAMLRKVFREGPA